MLADYLSPSIINKFSRRELLHLIYKFLNAFSSATPLVVSQLPETIPEGVLVIYDNELWRGLSPGESSLPPGTPWPAKGYKSYIARITDQPGGTGDHVLEVYKSNIGNGEFTKHSSQQYRIQFTSIPSLVSFFAPYQNYPQPFVDLPEFMSASVWFNPLNNLCTVSLWKAFEGDDETLSIYINAMFFPPPP